MSIKEEVLQGWNFALQAAGAQMGVQGSIEYLDAVEKAIQQLENDLNNHQYKNLDIGRLQGYMFEEFSADTFNINAVAAGSSDRAVVQHSLELDSVDVKLDSGTEYSMKSYQTGEKSAVAQARMDQDTREASYSGQKRMVPTDQLEAAKKEASRRAVKNAEKRPEVARVYEETGENLTDTIENKEGIQSIKVDRETLEDIAKDVKKDQFKAEDYDITPETVIKTEYILKQAAKAGMTAAAITMALQLAPEIIKTIDYLVKAGQIRTDNLLATGGKVISAGGESFLRGSVAFTLTQAIQEGKIAFLKSLNPTATGVLVAVTIQTVKDSILVSAGKMQARELGDSLLRTTLVTGGTILGMSAIAKAGGAAGQVILGIPVVGFVVGSLVGCTASVLYDVGKKHFISFCVYSGFTCFGLVEQDYSLSEDVLHDLGIETIPIPRIEIPRVELERIDYQQDVERIQVDTVQYTTVKRGVIGINRIGTVVG